MPSESISFYRQVNMVTRSDRDPSAVLGDLRSALQRLDPALPVSDAQTVTDVVSDSVKPQRFGMTVVGLFAIVALGLAAIGIYGVLANAVSQQTHEIGVRMALGANASAVMWVVLRRALMLMAIGVAIGTAGALALTRVMAGLLYEVRPTDAATFGGAALLLAGARRGREPHPRLARDARRSVDRAARRIAPPLARGATTVTHSALR